MFTQDAESALDSYPLIKRLALHRFHWLCILIGMIPMLFGDVFFLIGDWSLLSVRVNRIIFLPSLGYGFLALGCYCLFFLEGRSHLLRILPALHLFIGGVLAFSDPSAHQAILIYLY